MNFVNEQNIARREIRQQRSQIPGLFDRRAGGHTDARTHFVGDDACERRLAETRRAVEQHMVERLIAPSGGFNINGKVALGLFLSGIVGQQLRAQADFAVVLWGQACGDDGRVVFLRKIQAHAGPSLLLRRSAQRPADHVFDGKILKINALERRRRLRLRIAEADERGGRLCCFAAAQHRRAPARRSRRIPPCSAPAGLHRACP